MLKLSSAFLQELLDTTSNQSTHLEVKVSEALAVYILSDT